MVVHFAKRAARWLLAALLMLVLTVHSAAAATTYDVIVVGAGGAGLSAAATVAEGGLSVLVLEKMPTIGGNTLRASGLFNAADPERQKQMGISDSPEWHYEQMMASGGGYNTPAVVRRFTEQALPTLHWLEGLGVRFLPQMQTTWGAEWQRGHKPLLPRGQAYIRTLSATVWKHGGTILTNTPVVALLTDAQGRVNGVVAQRQKTSAWHFASHGESERAAIFGYVSLDGTSSVTVAKNASSAQSSDFERVQFLARKGVVIASGGFTANPTLIARYAPRLSGMSTDSGPGNTGEMLFAAEKVGAVLTGMSFIQLVPGAPAGRNFAVRLDLDAGRAIMVNRYGQRFIDEDSPRDRLSRAVLNEPAGSVCVITDQRAVSAMDMVSQKDVYRGLQTGDVIRDESLEGLARRMGLDPATLTETVKAFNVEVEKKQGKCARTACSPIAEPPFWASRIHLTIHSTMGGIVISPEARVLKEDGTPVPGLWAAGETTGNVHGENRIGGNGVADALTFGRIAGLDILTKSKP